MIAMALIVASLATASTSRPGRSKGDAALTFILAFIGVLLLGGFAGFGTTDGMYR